MPELKNCPWCKSTIGLVINADLCECRQHKWIYVQCERCGAKGPHALQEDDEEKLVEARKAAINWWNDRE